MFQQLVEEQPGTEPIFLLEEPEAHLHPQAARTLWDRITALPGQKLVTTHSPYFVQNVPLRNLRLVRLTDGASVVNAMPKRVSSSLPWNESVARLSPNIGNVFEPDPETNCVCATAWFETRHADNLKGCFRDQDEAAVSLAVENLRHASRGLVTAQEEHELSFIGRRIRGEIFFARRWILIEGQSEYVLLHAIGSEAKQSLCRLRFDLAHECGHLVMHRGVQTGDRPTEDQANRFASAFLLPRAPFLHMFPRSRFLNWELIFHIKLQWKVSARAVLRRAFDLGMISADQYRTGNIHLAKTGQTKIERYDADLPMESAELLEAAMDALESIRPGALLEMANELGLAAPMFDHLTSRALDMPAVRGDDEAVRYVDFTVRRQ